MYQNQTNSYLQSQSIQTSDRISFVAIALYCVCVCLWAQPLKAMHSNMCSHISQSELYKMKYNQCIHTSPRPCNYIVEKLNKQAIHLNEE